MNDFQLGRHRGVPLHGPAVQADAAETAAQDSLQDTAQTNALQQDAAPAPEVQLHAPAPKPLPIEAYTISVDQVEGSFAPDRARPFRPRHLRAGW